MGDGRTTAKINSYNIGRLLHFFVHMYTLDQINGASGGRVEDDNPTQTVPQYEVERDNPKPKEPQHEVKVSNSKGKSYQQFMVKNVMLI